MLFVLQAAGNSAFQSGRREVAIEHYSAALACNSSSRPFNAVCLANRAAAYQALDSIAEAIADCSRAIVLDPEYAKVRDFAGIAIRGVGQVGLEMCS